MKKVSSWLLGAAMAAVVLSAALTACSGGKTANPASAGAEAAAGAETSGVSAEAETDGAKTEETSGASAEAETDGAKAEETSDAAGQASEGQDESTGAEANQKRKFKGRITDKPKAEVGRPVLAVEGDVLIGEDNFVSLQGGCSDGEYIYIAEADQAHTGICIIYKISAETWEITATSDPLPIGHANDMEYNPKTHELLVIYTDDPNATKLTAVDPDTLTVTRMIDTKYRLFGLTYHEKTDTYAGAMSGGAHSLVFFDADFNKIDMTNEYYPVMTGGNLDSDDEYIYLSQAFKNCIICFNWDGEYVGSYYVSEQDRETEAMFHVGDTFYMSFWMSGPISLISPIEFDRSLLSTTGPDPMAEEETPRENASGSTNDPEGSPSLWLAAEDIEAGADGTVDEWVSRTGGVTAHLRYGAPRLQDVGDGKGVYFDGASSLDLTMPSYYWNEKEAFTVLMYNIPEMETGGEGTPSQYNSVLYFPENGSWGSAYFTASQNEILWRFGTGNEWDYGGVYQRPESPDPAGSCTVIRKDELEETIFIDGESVHSRTATGKTTKKIQSEGYIGEGKMDTFYTGTICEIQVYDRALTDEEIREASQEMMEKYRTGYEASVREGGETVNEYRIVYANDETSASNLAQAEMLQAVVDKACGFQPEIVSDDEPESELEILVGRTNRAESRQFYEGADALELMEYVVTTVNHKLVLAGAGGFSTIRAIEALEKGLRGDTKTLDGIDLGRTSLQNEFNSAPADGFRIMEYNILAEYAGWGSGGDINPDVDVRKEIIASIILGYRPDVCVLCEVYDTWSVKLPPLLEETYEFLQADQDDGMSNRTTVIYRRDRFDLIDGGYEDIAVSTSDPFNKRVAAWAVLRDKLSGQQLIVAGTHMDWNGEEEKRMEQAGLLCEAVRNAAEKYPGSVILTGDFNTEAGLPVYNRIKELTGYVNVFENEPGRSVDHMFADESVHVEWLKIDKGHKSGYASDHSPIICDITIE